LRTLTCCNNTGDSCVPIPVIDTAEEEVGLEAEAWDSTRQLIKHIFIIEKNSDISA